MLSPIRTKIITALIFVFILLASCTSTQQNRKNQADLSKPDSCSIVIKAGDFINSKSEEIVKIDENNTSYVKTSKGGWLEYKLKITETGRYKIRLYGTTSDSSDVACWIEDYVDNKDGRTYNISGNMMLRKASMNGIENVVEKDGSPLDSGLHVIRLHYDTGAVV